MRSAVLLCALLTSAGAATAAQPGLNPIDGTILPADAGKGLLHQCSRATPMEVHATWRPTKQQISELEILLPNALFAVTSTFRVPFHPTDFRRQYLGIVVGSRRLIYVNAFPRSAGDPSPGRDTSARTFDWRNDALVVCDGGPAFFGVEYDPARKAFDHFDFNGSP